MQILSIVCNICVSVSVFIVESWSEDQIAKTTSNNQITTQQFRTPTKQQTKKENSVNIIDSASVVYI